LHMAQLMPLPLTVSCFSKIQIGFTLLVPAHLGIPRKRAVKRACVCMCVCVITHSTQQTCMRDCDRAVENKHLHMNKNNFKTQNTLAMPKTRKESS